MLEIELTPDDDGWHGEGFLVSEGLFSPYDGMVGLDGDALGRIGAVVASVLEGAVVASANPATFRPEAVTYGFKVTLPAGEADDLGRRRLSLGDPDDGLMSLLPADVHLYEDSRGTPVLSPDALVQRVRVSLTLGDREVVRLPENREIVNSGRIRAHIRRTRRRPRASSNANWRSRPGRSPPRSGRICAPCCSRRPIPPTGRSFGSETRRKSRLISNVQ